MVWKNEFYGCRKISKSRVKVADFDEKLKLKEIEDIFLKIHRSPFILLKFNLLSSIHTTLHLYNQEGNRYFTDVSAMVSSELKFVFYDTYAINILLFLLSRFNFLWPIKIYLQIQMNFPFFLPCTER